MTATAQLELPLASRAEEAFWAFHLRQPQVFQRLLEKALRWKLAGHTHGSIKMFWEVMRWDDGIERAAGEEFKLNNNYHAHYARLLMRTVPELKGFFETREVRCG